VEFHVEALLVDPEAADLIWKAWNQGEFTEFVAVWAWWQIVLSDRSASQDCH
jgi:hypothetical protein